MKDEKKVNKKTLTPRQKAIHYHPYISVSVLCLSIDANTIGRISKQYSNFELHVCMKNSVCMCVHCKLQLVGYSVHP